jgi:hypothetical protein
MKKRALLLCTLLVVSTPAWAVAGPCRITDIEIIPSPPTTTGEVRVGVTFQAPTGSGFTDTLAKVGGQMNLTINVYCPDPSAPATTFYFEEVLGTNMKPGAYMLNTTLWSHSDVTVTFGGLLNLIFSRAQLCGVWHTSFQVAPITAQ